MSKNAIMLTLSRVPGSPLVKALQVALLEPALRKQAILCGLVAAGGKPVATVTLTCPVSERAGITAKEDGMRFLWQDSPDSGPLLRALADDGLAVLGRDRDAGSWRRVYAISPSTRRARRVLTLLGQEYCGSAGEDRRILHRLGAFFGYPPSSTAALLRREVLPVSTELDLPERLRPFAHSYLNPRAEEENRQYLTRLADIFRLAYGEEASRRAELDIEED